MKRITTCLAAASVVVSLSPASAEEERGFSLMEEGAKLFMRGMMQEMQPALDELESMLRDMKPALESFASEMGPALRDLMSEVEDWSLYEPPQMLPNGDIIIRRKVPKAQPENLPETEPGDEIEL